MNIYISKQGEKNGPYSGAQIIEFIRSGAYSMSDLIWREGMAEWQPIHSVADIAEAVLPPLPQTTLLPQQELPVQLSRSEAQQPDQSLSETPRDPKPSEKRGETNKPPSTPSSDWILFIVGICGFVGLGVGVELGFVVSHYIGLDPNGGMSNICKILFAVLGLAVPIVIANGLVKKWPQYFGRANRSEPRNDQQQPPRVETVAPSPAHHSVKVCSYCGAKYPNDMTQCPQDGEPLQDETQQEGTGGKIDYRVAGVAAFRFLKGMLFLALLAYLIWAVFFDSDDHTLIHGLERSLEIFSHGHGHE